MPDSGSFDELSYLKEEVARLRRRLNELTPDIATLLKRRGFRVCSREPSDDLLIPEEEFIEGYYAMLGKYSFRLFLRDVIKHQDFFALRAVTRYATAHVTEQYLDYMVRIKLVREMSPGYCLDRRIRSFGQTLEWYFAQVLKREFSADAIRGAKFKGRQIGGDYDVIAKLDGLLLYAEVKSSPPKQIYDREIAAFLERIGDLSPEISFFFMDTELRMKDKIVPLFEEALRKTGGALKGVERIEKELFQIGGRIFIINAKDSIVRNIETVLGMYFRRYQGS